MELLWGKTLTVPQSLLTFYSNYSGAKCKRYNQERHSRQPWLAVPAPHVRLLQVWTLTSKNFNLISKDSSYWPPKPKPISTLLKNVPPGYVVVEGCTGRHRAVGKQSRIVALFGFGGQRLWQRNTSCLSHTRHSGLKIIFPGLLFLPRIVLCTTSIFREVSVSISKFLVLGLVNFGPF